MMRGSVFPSHVSLEVATTSEAAVAGVTSVRLLASVKCDVAL